MSIEALKHALETLEEVQMAITTSSWMNRRIEELRAAIEQAEKREWQGLTDEDIYSIIESNVPPKLTSLFEMAEWMAKVVEARLKEKNNAI